MPRATATVCTDRKISDGAWCQHWSALPTERSSLPGRHPESRWICPTKRCLLLPLLVPLYCYWDNTSNKPTAGGGDAAQGQSFPSYQTLLIEKWKQTLLWDLHSDPKQLQGTGEAAEKQEPSGAPSSCFFGGQHRPGALQLALPCLSASHFFVLSSLFLNPNALFSFLSLPWFSSPLLFLLCRCVSLPLHASPPRVLPSFPFISSTYTIPPSSFTVYIFLCARSFFHPLSLPSANSKPVSPSVFSSPFLPWCHFNYWPILCLLSSLSLFPFPLPLGLQLVSPHLFQGCRCRGFVDVCRFVCFYHHTPLLLFSCLSLHFPLSAYPSPSIITSLLSQPVISHRGHYY